IATAAHGEHAAHVLPDDAHFGAASPGKIGMWVFLLSDAFSFGGLLLAYGILRGGSDHLTQPWHHAREPHPRLNFTAGLTFLLICSSVTMVLAVASAKEGNRKQTLLMLGLTALGGALFLCGQMQEYFGVFHGEGLVREGLIFGHSGYASTFYVTT